MKTSFIHRPILGLIMTAAAASADAQSGGPFTLNWSTADGGGGVCSGGIAALGGTRFSLSGTVGQPDGGVCTAGALTLQSGFVPGFIKTVGPPLSMTRAGNQLNFIWPNLGTGFHLEGASTANGPWTSLSNGTLVGPNWQATVPSTSSPSFFRLKKDCPN